MTEKLAVGIDIGGTFIKSGLISDKGEIIAKDSWPIRKKSRLDLYSQFEELIQHWSHTKKNAELIGAGIGVPGFINHKTGILDKSPNLQALDGAHIFQDLQEMLSIPVVVDNDANAAAWGEYWAGDGQGSELLILITLGTGIGSGIIWNGSVWHGCSGYAGEIGHSLIVPDGQLCNCGMHGCIEAYFSATAMLRDARAAIEAGDKPTCLKNIKPPLRGKHIFQAAAKGDSVSLEIVSLGARRLGMTIGNVINLLNPDQIVLGGGIIASAELLMPMIIDAARDRSIPGPFASCKIRPSKLGNDAGLLGSAGLVWQHLADGHLPVR